MSSSIISSPNGAPELARMSSSGLDSSRTTIEVTACFGQGPAPDASSQFWAATGSPTLPAPEVPFSSLRLPSSRVSELIAVEPLSTTEVDMSGSGAFHSERSPALQDTAAASFAAVGGLGALQEITQNLRKTMVGLSNEVKARESEDWRLEQSFTQLDSRRELMCVQLHTRYEQTKHEIEALAKQINELHSRTSSADSNAAELAKECNNQVQAQITEMQRFGASTSRLESQMNSLNSAAQRLKEKQISLEASVRLIEEYHQKSQVESLHDSLATARSDIQQLQAEGKDEVQQLSVKCALFERRMVQIDEQRAQHRKEVEDLRISMKQLEARLERQGPLDDMANQTNALDVERLKGSIAQLNSAVVEVRAENSAQADEKYSTLENRLTDNFTDLKASSLHFESKLQNLSNLITSQDELLKAEVGARKDLQTRLDILQSKGELEATQLRNSLQETNLSSTSSEQVSRLQARHDAQERQMDSMKGLLDSLQGRMETFQSQSESGRQQFEETLRKEKRGMDELCQKVEKTSSTLRELVEAQASGTEASLKRLDAELQEGRRYQVDEIKRLESRVSITSDGSQDGSVKPEQVQNELASLRVQLQSPIDRLQMQIDALETKVSTTALTSSAASSEGSFLDKAQLNCYREEWKIALEEERALNAEKVKSLGRTVSEECRAQAATQARMIVQSMLAQELDAWRSELNSVSQHLAREPLSSRARSKSRTRPDGEDEDDLLPTEAVKRLDDRIALQRREAAALDELLRSELEVQRRQQSLTTAAMNSVQERLALVEKQSNALRSQIENTFRDEARSQETEDSGPKNEELESALKVIADAVSDLPVPQQSSDDDVHRRIKKLSERMSVAYHSPPGSVSVPRSVSGVMPQHSVSATPKHGSISAPLGQVRCSREAPSPRRDDVSSLGSGQAGAYYDTLNMPQALEELGRANYVHREHSHYVHRMSSPSGGDSALQSGRGGPRTSRIRHHSQGREPEAPARIAASYSTPSLNPNPSQQPPMFASLSPHIASSPRPVARQPSPKRGVQRQPSPPVPPVNQRNSAKMGSPTPRPDQNVQKSLAESRIQRLSTPTVPQAKQPQLQPQPQHSQPPALAVMRRGLGKASSPA